MAREEQGPLNDNLTRVLAALLNLTSRRSLQSTVMRASLVGLIMSLLLARSVLSKRVHSEPSRSAIENNFPVS